MRRTDLRHLAGPNVFTASPVTLARLELDELTGRETTDYPGLATRLTRLLPGLAGHHCAAGRPGGFLAALDRGTYFGHVAEHVALELSCLAGREVCLGRTLWAGADGHYDVVLECPLDEAADSPVPAMLLDAAIAITDDLVAGRAPDIDARLASITSSFQQGALGVSTAALADAARRRGIPVRRVGATSMLRLGYGRNRRLLCAALTEVTSAVGVDIAADKMLSKQLLAGAGIPVPEGVLAASARDAARALDTFGAPVVVKPLRGNHGRCVTVGVRTPDEAAAAFERAGGAGSPVIVERFVTGHDYRVLVIDGRVAAAAQLRPASVTGDGSHTISQLVARVNADPRRGNGHARELTRITLDDEVMRHLDAAGLDGGAVPAAGQAVALRQNANLSTGGTSRDVTDLVHDDVAALCVRAAAAAGLDICGVDLRADDISAPLRADHAGAAVLELNACPGLRMHLAPAQGRARDVAAAIVDTLYPPGTQARIPVIAVTGTNGKTTTVRMIGHVLSQAGLRVGMATTDGVYSGGRLAYDADASGPRSAEMVLDDTSVEAAVLETARGGILRGGLGYDRADVAVVTNITADHLGADGVDDMTELIHVKALVAEEVRAGGTVVLNADDPAVAGLADRPAVRRNDPGIRFFSQQPGNPVLERHKRSGGLAYEVCDGELAEIEGGRTRPLIPLAELPGAFGGAAAHLVANALAAAAACRAAGFSAKDIRRGLATFTPAEVNPGRGNVYRAGDDQPVIVDYGHNAAALDATGAMITKVWGGEPAAAVTLPGDRRDDLVTETAEAIAAWFGKVVVYEDGDKRGRRPGEMQELIATAMRRVRPDIICVPAAGPEQALRHALALADGAPTLFLYEKLAAARAAVASIGAVSQTPVPWPDASPAAERS
ncbi:MAG TPA: cyanophycin synthetase [Streptosporangiaceae bacterium]|nr:cyanophycin synthetase [Streptosporangiaceae bacterium]